MGWPARRVAGASRPGPQRVREPDGLGFADQHQEQVALEWGDHDVQARELESDEARLLLPQFEGKKLPARPLIEIPEGTVAVDVPLDPALAIANRFQELAK